VKEKFFAKGAGHPPQITSGKTGIAWPTVTTTR
jgi:hypothetical protein